MKLAIIGNMNNNANNLIRYLADQGLDCSLLFYENEAGHFTPESDNIDPATYPSVHLGWGSYKNLYQVPARQIRQDLEPFDFLIGSRLAPAYLAKAGRELDIFMPTGGDIHMLPMFSGWQPKDLVKFLLFSRRQFQGIRRSRTIYFDVTNPETEHKIAKVVAGLDRIEHAIPAIYYPSFEGESLQRRRSVSDTLARFRAERADADIVLFHHVKQVWTREAVNHYGFFHEKGNDQIVVGLKLYYDSQPSKRIKIIMFEYGSDHPNTKALAKSLGVDRHISWYPQTPRKELMLGIGEADGVVGEVTRSWFSYGTMLEALTMGKALIHHRDDALYPSKRLYPMVGIQDAASFAQALHGMAAGQIDLADIGRRGKQWLVEYGVGQAVTEIMARVRAKAARRGG